MDYRRRGVGHGILRSVLHARLLRDIVNGAPAGGVEIVDGEVVASREFESFMDRVRTIIDDGRSQINSAPLKQHHDAQNQEFERSAIAKHMATVIDLCSGVHNYGLSYFDVDKPPLGTLARLFWHQLSIGEGVSRACVSRDTFAALAQLRQLYEGGYNAIGGARKAHELYKDELVGTTLAEKSVAWIRESKATGDDPFFLYLSTTNIHHPFTPAPRFRGTSECGLYGDFIHEFDWIVGEVMNVVEEIGQSENTLFIVRSDNGGMLNQGGQDAWRAGHRLNGDLLGFKFGAWEGGHRIPFIAKWPGQIPPASVSDDLFCQVDLLATFAGIVGRPLNEGEGIDSVDQLETLVGQPNEPLRTEVITSPNSPEHLYDLEADPHQTTNVYSAYPRVVEELDAIVARYRKEVGPTDSVGWINAHAVRDQT
jgi:hypothetical protein